jgi:hypothetical protein
MPEHHVTWEIDGIEADSREDAARQCREMLLDPANTASGEMGCRRSGASGIAAIGERRAD